jgi:glycine hydroxymethyltransferase
LAEQQAEGVFVFEAEAKPPMGSVLYKEHLKLSDKSHIAEFAGFLMPLWYSSISEEHAAVRRRAGVFDCTHMGAIEVSGDEAELFLNAVTTNKVEGMRLGAAQYGYILDAAGNVLDDIIIYRRGADRFMVVVNAANEPKIKAYLAAVLAGEAVTDLDKPNRRIMRATVRDMKDTSPGAPGDCRVDIALQGPASLDVLCKLTDDQLVVQRMGTLKSFTFFEAKLAGIDCIISRTGYTGAKVCFELFVHPDFAAKIWWRLLDEGKELGVVPCGLGARDSLRIEAGLPLYGHELDGTYNISPFEAGYGWAVKLDKEFFIGKAAMEKVAKTWHGLPARENTAKMTVPPMNVARIELPGEKGVRPVRQGDGVIIDRICAGWVLSCAKAGERQVALVYAQKDKAVEGNSVGVYYLARSENQKSKGKKEAVQRGDKLEADVWGKVVSRFEKF